jgi:hypothetical protein
MARVLDIAFRDGKALAAYLNLRQVEDGAVARSEHRGTGAKLRQHRIQHLDRERRRRCDFDAERRPIPSKVYDQSARAGSARAAGSGWRGGAAAGGITAPRLAVLTKQACGRGEYRHGDFARWHPDLAPLDVRHGCRSQSRPKAVAHVSGCL